MNDILRKRIVTNSITQTLEEKAPPYLSDYQSFGHLSESFFFQEEFRKQSGNFQLGRVHPPINSLRPRLECHLVVDFFDPLEIEKTLLYKRHLNTTITLGML